MRLNNQRGFTLLELLVVVAIIGALAGIAIPQYNSLREKGERASIISECGSIYRMLIVYFIEYDGYPNATVSPPGEPPVFDLTTLSPISNPAYMGGSKPDIDVPLFMKKFQNNKAEAYDSPDDTLGTNQEFYLVLAWAKDPSIKYVIAQSDDVFYGDGSTKVDNGNWVDGIYATKGGEILGK
jgi:prepilin-type N-terminal cleavage/methylation domain-containing protein